MKRKTINSVIYKKINDWLISIDDTSLSTMLRSNIIVTGGCITSMLLNEDVNDFDIYFKTKEATKRVSEYYCKKFNERNKGFTNKLGKNTVAYVLDGEDVDDWKNGSKSLSSITNNTYPDFSYNDVVDWQYVEGDEDANKTLNVMSIVSGMVINTPKDRVKIMIQSDGIAEDSDSVADDVEYDINQYLDALGDGDEIPQSELDKEQEKYYPVFLSTNAITLSNKIQLITRFYGEPDEIHTNYDFVHATNYWTTATGVVLKERALEAILNKELLYVGSKYPIASLIRTRKFIKRGWQINAGQYVKMAWQISELDLTDIYTLEDQLVGVDSIYFLNFIENMKRRHLKDNNFEMSRDYVTSVIDKLFG